MKHTASRFTCSLRSLRIRSLAFAHLALLIPFVLPADTFGPYTYTVSDGQATITDFDSTCSGNLSITNELGGCPVISIGDDAFRNRTALTDVTIPDSVTNIGNCAFAGCTNLTTILFTSNAPTIQDNSFDNTPATLYYLPETTGWSETVAERPTKLIPLWYSSDGTQITITDLDHRYVGHIPLPTILDGCPVTSIGPRAFYGCINLTSVTLPESLTNISDEAFYDCSALSDIIIPSDITNIGSYAFAGCTNLTSVLFTGDLPTIQDNTFDNTHATNTLYYLPDTTGWSETAAGLPTKLVPLLYSSNGTQITITGLNDDWWGYTGHLPLPAVLNGLLVTAIADGAFVSRALLTSVTIPDSVTSIGSYAFEHCTSLTSVLFTGNAPAMNTTVFYSAPATLYYLPGTTGWSSSFAGRPAVCWNPAFSSTSLASGVFAFTLTGNASIPVRIQASDSLMSPHWLPLSDTVIPASGTLDFIDPDPLALLPHCLPPVT